MIESYLKNNKDENRNIYNEWFKDGKYHKETFFEKHNFKGDDGEMLDEWTAHNQWKEETKLRATPTILINGYELPGNYKIEDLRYFTNLEVDTK